MKNKFYKEAQHVVIPLGDPAGIGIEVTLKALASPEIPQGMQPILVGCKKSLEFIYLKLKEKSISPIANPSELQIKDIPIEGKLAMGYPSANTGAASFHWLTDAANYLIRGEARALVTAPISKYAWHKAGHTYAGQTERLAEITKSNNPSI